MPKRKLSPNKKVRRDCTNQNSEKEYHVQFVFIPNPNNF